MARHDRARRFRFVTAQSALGQALYRRHGLDPAAMETNIVLVGGRAFTRLASFAAAMGALGWPWKILALSRFMPRMLGDPLYRLIAENRYRLGRRHCLLPSAEVRGRLIE